MLKNFKKMLFTFHRHVINLTKLKKGRPSLKKNKKKAKPKMNLPIEIDDQLEQRPPPVNTKNFRLQGKNFFLTYPKMPTELDTLPGQKEHMEKCLANLKHKYGTNLDKVIIAWEHHKGYEGEEGDPHMHICFAVKNKIQINGVAGMRLLDDFGGKHGDYKCARNFQQSVIYLTKENNYLVHNLDIEKLKSSFYSKKGFKFDMIAQKLQTGISVQDINKEAPGFVLQHYKKLKDYENILESWKVDQKVPWLGMKPYIMGRPPAELKIIQWLNNNVKKERPHKKLQLWIHGPTGVGKTTLWNETLDKALRIFIVPYDADWMDGYTDDYDLIVFDEYHAHKPITWLNSFVEGVKFPLRRRGMLPFTKRKNIPVIVFSNYSMNECYKHANEQNSLGLVALHERFEEVEVIDLLEIELQDPPTPTEIIENNDTQEVLVPGTVTQHGQIEPQLPNPLFRDQEYVTIDMLRANEPYEPEIFETPNIDAQEEDSLLEQSFSDDELYENADKALERLQKYRKRKHSFSFSASDDE